MAPSNSFSAPPAPSRVSIRLPDLNREPPVFKAFAWAFVAVFVLVLFGGSTHPFVSGLSLLIPGVLILVRPPKRGLGKLVDLGVLGLLGVMLLAFLPQFYWPSSEWRESAIEQYGMNLPASLSVQPWLSFEAWLLVLGGVAWFYSTLQWKTNLNGRRWLFAGLSVVVCLMAGAVVLGTLWGARYPGSDAEGAFSFFPKVGQTANFLLLAGLLTFGFAMEGVRDRKTLPLVALPSTLICLYGLVLIGSRVGVLLYFGGVLVWCVRNLNSSSFSRRLKQSAVLLTIAAVALVVWNDRISEKVHEFFQPNTLVESTFKSRVYPDVIKMISDSPVAGVGLGAFGAVFPQYRDISADTTVIHNPMSDWLWLVSENGLLAFVFIFTIGVGFLINCRGFTKGSSVNYRIFCAIALSAILLFSLVDVPFHHSGTAYFALLVAALVLPKNSRPHLRIPPWLWRFAGCVLVFMGVAWVFAGLFNLPLHSSTRIERFQAAIAKRESVADFDEASVVAGKWARLTPLDWEPYFKRAQFGLEANEDLSQVSADFKRARFSEPNLARITFDEGLIWLQKDPIRAIEAWEATLDRQADAMLGLFDQMVAALPSSPKVVSRFSDLSRKDPVFRTQFLLSLKRGAFMDALRVDLASDPSLSAFSIEERSRLLLHWIKNGNLASAETFLNTYSDSVNYSWWMQSCIHKERAEFSEAVRVVRENVEVPELPHVEVDAFAVPRLAREFTVAPNDFRKGITLTAFYLEAERFDDALRVLDQLRKFEFVDPSTDYWRAECLYQLQETIESWYAFQAYFSQLWELPNEDVL